MSVTPLHVVFEKRLSDKPSLPSPSMKPQSILVKQYPFPLALSSSNTPENNRSISGVAARRGSDSSTSSSSSMLHDCYACSVQDESALEQAQAQNISRISSELLPSHQGRQLRVQWVDRV
ncbi:hypothetical protein EDD11_002499 [Mortierella claussenii]|nr:hypothetical protein EDD11_002499 [Mortierella claussenii]